jgi:hypothetical protein
MSDAKTRPGRDRGKSSARRPGSREGRAAPRAAGEVEEARRQGDALEERGDPRAAVAVLEKAAGRDADPDLLVDLGYARLTAGDAGGGRGAVARGLGLRPAVAQIRRPQAQN